MGLRHGKMLAWEVRRAGGPHPCCIFGRGYVMWLRCCDTMRTMSGRGCDGNAAGGGTEYLCVELRLVTRRRALTKWCEREGSSGGG